jgi:hypothetical protein
MALAGAIALPLQLCQVLQLHGGRAAPHRGRVRRVGRPASHIYHLPPSHTLIPLCTVYTIRYRKFSCAAGALMHLHLVLRASRHNTQVVW